MIDPEELFRAVHECRLLVFMENGNHFQQVSLDGEQFKKISDAIVKIIKPRDKAGDEVVEIQVVDNIRIPAKIFENLNSIHDVPSHQSPKASRS